MFNCLHLYFIMHTFLPYQMEYVSVTVQHKPNNNLNGKTQLELAIDVLNQFGQF